MFSVYYRTLRDEALRVLFLVEQDPARLARLRELYTVRHDVLNALWWRLHPRETSPRGVADPVIERDGPQRQTFSRAGETAPTLEQRDVITGAAIRSTADEHLLRELDAHLSEDARALDAAVARFGADFPAGEAAGVPAIVLSADRGSMPHRRRRQCPRRRRRPRRPAGAVGSSPPLPSGWRRYWL